jgi:fumarate reductase subunit D
VSGLILLVLLGVLVAFGFTRVRRRMNMNVTSRHWIGAILVVVIVSLILWASTTGHHCPGAGLLSR